MTEIKTKICNCCGRELPETEFYDHKNVEKTCKDCLKIRAAKSREHRKELKIAERNGINLFPIERKYKNIADVRILTDDDIERIAGDEIFVRIMDSPCDWSSNYGRLIREKDGVYELVEGILMAGHVMHYVVKNIRRKNGWVLKKQMIQAEKLVVGEFVVNPDCEHNGRVYHLDGDLQNNYYENLYPLNKKQFDAVKKLEKIVGEVTEDDIIRIMNNKEYSSLKNMNRALEPKVCEIGYYGCDDFISTTKEYAVWLAMMYRCYGENSRAVAYDDCTITEEWWNYANFRKWYREHYYDFSGATMEIDKDITVKGNREYGPSTCAIVPGFINLSVLNCEGKRGDHPMGIAKVSNYYVVTGNTKSQKIKDMRFNTAEEAFAVYKAERERHLHKLGASMRGKIPEAVCNSLAAWTINITD